MVNLNDHNRDHKALFKIFLVTYWMIDLFLCVKLKEKYKPVNCSLFSACNFIQNVSLQCCFPETKVDKEIFIEVESIGTQLYNKIRSFCGSNFTILPLPYYLTPKMNHKTIYYNCFKFNIGSNLFHMHSP